MKTFFEVSYVGPKKQIVALTNKACFKYDKLLLATGGKTALPPFPGIYTSKGIFTLRTIEDINRIDKTDRISKSAIIIGGGLLGIEAGNVLRKLGLSVIRS